MSDTRLPCHDKREKAVTHLVQGNTDESASVLEDLVEKQKEMRPHYDGHDRKVLDATIRADSSLKEKVEGFDNEVGRQALILHMKNKESFKRMGLPSPDELRESSVSTGSGFKISNPEFSGVDEPALLKDRLEFLKQEFKRSQEDLKHLRQLLDDELLQKPVVGLKEDVVVTGRSSSVFVTAKCDSGASSSSVDRELAEEVGYRKVGTTTITSATGCEERDLAEFDVVVDGEAFSVRASISDRSGWDCRVLLGRDVLTDFLISV